VIWRPSLHDLGAVRKSTCPRHELSIDRSRPANRTRNALAEGVADEPPSAADEIVPLVSSTLPLRSPTIFVAYSVSPAGTMSREHAESLRANSSPINPQCTFVNAPNRASRYVCDANPSRSSHPALTGRFLTHRFGYSDVSCGGGDGCRGPCALRCGRCRLGQGLAERNGLIEGGSEGADMMEASQVSFHNRQHLTRSPPQYLLWRISYPTA
jgi:hypothetical protein